LDPNAADLGERPNDERRPGPGQLTARSVVEDLLDERFDFGWGDGFVGECQGVLAAYADAAGGIDVNVADLFLARDRNAL
jgi:hypothetical protein